MTKRFFFISLLLAAFVWGFITHWNQYFPYQIVNKAHIAYKALMEVKNDQYREVVRKETLWYPIWEKSGLKRPTAKTFSPSRGNEKIFVLGDKRSLFDVCPKVGCLAWIIDREGNVLHAWKNKPDLWTFRNTRKSPGYDTYPVCAHVYPNGDLLVNYHGNATFPYAIGLAKFDKDSNLIWKKEEYYHHWFTVDSQGRILTPAIRLVQSPLEINDRKYKIKCEQGMITAEYIAILDPEGNKIKSIDLTTALNKSDLMSMLVNTKACDPFHLNMIDINEDPTRQSRVLGLGDLLISIRSMNTIGVLEKESDLFKWYFNGPLVRQHSSVFFNDSEIFVVDNAGGPQKKGTSRVVSINVDTNEIKTIFPRENVKLPTWDFFIQTGGFLTVYPDRSRMLVAFTYPSGFIWEIDIKTGEVLWEYRNITPIEKVFLRIPIYTALYADNFNFPFNNGQVQ
ncbi:MAG: hypothetical protein KAJ70_00265 [Candidatus Omnitrophica bacterium]|nr:hypothetical protein [Candidatus Omnitrophota bacterium]